MGVLEDIMGKDPEMTVREDLDFSDEADADTDSDIEMDDDGEVTAATGATGYSNPKGLVFKPVATLPKRASNLTGREGIRWEEVLEPITQDPNVNYIVFEHNFTDHADMRRKTNLCASKAGSIRRRLDTYAPDEDWEVTVRTDAPNKHVAIYAKYLGELTDERRQEKEERKAKYSARAAKAKANQGAE